MFYCEGKYLTESSCNSDTLCTYTIDSEGNEICFPSTLQFRRAVVKGEEVNYRLSCHLIVFPGLYSEDSRS